MHIHEGAWTEDQHRTRAKADRIQALVIEVKGSEKVNIIILSSTWAPKSLWMVTAAMKWRHLLLGRKAMTNLDSVLKRGDNTLPTKICIVKAMWELDHTEGWAPKNWGFQTVVLEKTLESSLDSKKIKPVNPKGNQSWIFIGRTDTEAEAPILWPPDVKSQLIGKYFYARKKNWGQEGKGTTEDEMVGWPPQLNGHECKQTLGDSDREAWCAEVLGVT